MYHTCISGQCSVAPEATAASAASPLAGEVVDREGGWWTVGRQTCRPAC